MLIEKSIKYNKSLILLFLDFEKTFETMELSTIIAALEDCEIDRRYTNLI